MDTINKQINKYRTKFGYSMQELGDKLGVAAGTISYWEAGKTSPRMGKVKQMADIFNIDPHALIFGDEIPVDASESDLLLLAKLNRQPEMKRLVIEVLELNDTEIHKINNIVKACMNGNS